MPLQPLLYQEHKLYNIKRVNYYKQQIANPMEGHGVSHFLQDSISMTPQPLPSKSFPTHHLSVILPSDAI
jgi:hypothetical protein